MNRMKCFALFAINSLLVTTVWGVTLPHVYGRTHYVLPSTLYGPLFYDVMQSDSLFGENNLFVESKTFTDVVPLHSVSSILAQYQHWNNKSLSIFLTRNFLIPQSIEKQSTDHAKDINQHIKSLWAFLTCPADSLQEGSRIEMRHPYFVPGGRFREMYYWDSYFSMLGMLCDHEDRLVMNMLDNFADVINRIGFIPNGMRSYYIGRSQPPYFSYMVEDVARHFGDSIYTKYLTELEKEYAFWMRGADSVSAGRPALLRVVRMKGGELLNRYFDNYALPREEAYRNDIETGRKLQQQNPALQLSTLYRNLRAGAESGLDFSSRWFADGKHLYTIRTTDMVPVDLNCLLLHLEQMIAKGYALNGNKAEAARYTLLAGQRGRAILKYCWDRRQGFFVDYVWTTGRQSPYLSLCGLSPLFSGIATPKQAKAVEQMVQTTFLKAGGCVTTPYNTGEQWDAPNGWAPLQWVTYKGLRRYALNTTADTLRTRWMQTVRKVYDTQGVIKEKYDVVGRSDTGGGEYSNQTGFGWTNGVFRAMETDQ